MPLRFWFHLAEIAFVIVLAAALYVSWHDVRLQHDQLTAALVEAKQTISAAEARQRDRDTQLSQTLAGLAVLKAQIQTPAQIAKDLPNQIPLPSPLVVQTVPPAQASARQLSATTDSERGTNPLAKTSGLPSNPNPSATQTVIPSQDLKPLYDFALDCKSCQAKLAASQADLTNERTKTAALGKERDAALKAAKGGSFLQRITRAAKWFALGAAAGALAAKSAH
jgi:hypothetical protein